MKRKVQTVVIETPEHFELSFRLAGIGTRFLAYFFDKLIQAGLALGLILTVVFALFLFGKLALISGRLVDAVRGLDRWLIALGILAYGVLAIGYFILFEYFWSGSTPGKKAEGIRVIRKDGRPVTFWDAAIRNVMRFIDVLGEVYPIGLVVMFVDSYNRRLGDLTAGTLVILDTQTGPLLVTESYEGLSKFDEEIVQVIRQMSAQDYHLVTKFLGRRESLVPDHREQLAREIYERIFKMSPHPGMEAQAVEQALEAAAAVYRQTTRIL